MSHEVLSLLLTGLAFMALIVIVGVGIGMLLAKAGRAPQRSPIADVLAEAAVLEQRYRDERAKREQAEWEVRELQADVANLNKRVAGIADLERKAEEYDALELENEELKRTFDAELGRVADKAQVSILQLEAVKRNVPGVRLFIASLGDAGAHPSPPPQTAGDADE